MTTFAYVLAAEIGGRFDELNAIIKRAEAEFDQNAELYDILCRAGAVLAVSALEGFLKDINVAIQSDLNANLATFADMPKKMQREFCNKVVQFEGVPDPEVQKRINQLLKFFSANSVAIDMSAFPYKENANKNPSANVVDAAFSRYGINSILYCLADSKFEAVFDNDSATDTVLRRDVRRMRATIFAFPYRALPMQFKMEDWIPAKGQAVPTSIWHTFLENILGRRHSIVHADTRGNPTSWQALKEDANKLEIMFHGLLLAATSLVGLDLLEPDRKLS